jgi:hypothetical protein
MKPENHAWVSLHDHAAAMLRPGFADRTLRAARVVAPTFASQILLSVATATICLAVVVFVNGELSQSETAQNLAGWKQIADDTQALSLAP